MSTTYRVLAGDTFESIARKRYGTEQLADNIQRANPGTFEPLTPGTGLIIPAIPSAPTNLQTQTQTPATSEDEVAVLIAGKRFRFWTSVRVTRSVDSMDTIEITAPFDENSADFRESFRPFTYKPMTVTVGGSPFFTGTMVAVNPLLESSQKTVTASGYATPGVMDDCTPPASAFPIEFNDQGLSEIAKTMAAMFGVSVDFIADQGATFDRVACEPGKRALAFLVELAKQRNIIVSSTERGALRFWQSVEAGRPVAVLQQGGSPVLSVAPSFNPQQYYSHITAIEPVIPGLGGAQFTVKNPQLTNVVRPLSFTAPDATSADIKESVDAKMGRMFGNIASYTVALSTWRDPNGNLWQPNTTLKLTAPAAMIYNEYEFIIRSVEFNRDRSSETATLTLVLPGSFSGQVPEVLPWDG